MESFLDADKDPKRDLNVENDMQKMKQCHQNFEPGCNYMKI